MYHQYCLLLCDQKDEEFQYEKDLILRSTTDAHDTELFYNEKRKYEIINCGHPNYSSMANTSDGRER